MGQNNDLTAILVLLGLGYLVLKKPVEEAAAAITQYREEPRPWIMYSPLYLPPEPWRPIPGPAYRGPPLNGNGYEYEEGGEPSPGIPGPAYTPRRRNGNGFFRLPTRPTGPLIDKFKDVWSASTRGTPIPGPALQVSQPFKIGPRFVKPPEAPGLATQLAGGRYARLPPAPETPSYGGEKQE